MATTEETPKVEPENTTESFDFGAKKKKKKKEKVKFEDEVEETPETAAVAEKGDETPSKQEETSTGLVSGKLEKKSSTTNDYTYEELVGRVFSLISSTRPEEKTVYKMKPPVVYREGTKKTVWVNFPEICRIMNRQPDHVVSFVLAEVGSTGSIDAAGRLIMKGRFQPKHIESLLRKYISEYVKCQTCKSPETVLKKENRLLFVVCSQCGSSRSVAAIKTGFQATTRETRKQSKLEGS